MYSKKSIKDVDVTGKRVILRVDYNVPIMDGTVTDDKRIRASLPTLQYLLEHDAKVIILSHLGRPRGTGYESEYSLFPVSRVLGRIISQRVTFVEDITGIAAQAAVSRLQNGEVLMLENARFDARDTEGDLGFAKEIAELGDLFCNDAFGAAHRDNASIAGVPQFLPAVSGLLMDKELETLTGMLYKPKKPFVAILGGSKVRDKIQLINHLLEIVDVLLIGGGMGYTFLAAKGYDVGDSLLETNFIDAATVAMDKAKKRGVKLLTPIDIVVNDNFSEEGPIHVVAADEIPKDMQGLDIGPATRELYAQEIAAGRTVFWNGPMGVFEMNAFAEGTKSIAEALAHNKAGATVVGGGDSASAIAKFGLADEVTFVSTGGGASMALLEGRTLPGVDCLMDKDA